MLLSLVVVFLSVTDTLAYSALRDAQIIAEFKQGLERNHAKIARELVHRTNWASVGTISGNEVVRDYPMVNIISIDDNNAKNVSTGVIRFLLTDLDFTGIDWQINNKVTFMFSDEQNLNCRNAKKDPMEPTCARAMISGQVKKLSKNSPNYNSALNVFIARHPAATNWLKGNIFVKLENNFDIYTIFHTRNTEHAFYLCELDIQNIFVLDFYGGPHQVKASDYYATSI